jgi:hypothetical protein
MEAGFYQEKTRWKNYKVLPSIGLGTRSLLFTHPE